MKKSFYFSFLALAAVVLSGCDYESYVNPSNPEDTSPKPPAVACTMEYAPVCGADGQTYSNRCMAEKGAGVTVVSEGECGADTTSQVTAPPNCLSWFDGCNTCKVGQSQEMACTRMACPDETRENPKCLAYDFDSDGIADEIPTNCLSFFDGCNTCVVDANLQLTACTLKFCEERGEFKCVKYQE